MIYQSYLPPLVIVCYCSTRYSNSTIQTASAICTFPTEVSVYKRIQKYDTVRILTGPFLNVIGTVNQICHGTGWFIMKTSSQYLQLYRTDIELEDRLCIDDFVRVTGPGQFFRSQGTIREVDAKGNVEVAVMPSGVSSKLILGLYHIHNAILSMVEYYLSCCLSS